VAGRLIVAKSKTEAGEGRTIPLTNRVCATMTLWLSRFPEAGPDSFIFPHHRVACRSGRAEHHLYELDLATPIGSWKRAWKYACSEREQVSATDGMICGIRSFRGSRRMPP